MSGRRRDEWPVDLGVLGDETTQGLFLPCCVWSQRDRHEDITAKCLATKNGSEMRDRTQSRHGARGYQGSFG